MFSSNLQCLQLRFVVNNPDIEVSSCAQFEFMFTTYETP